MVGGDELSFRSKTLKEWREAQGLLQGDAAKFLGITQAFLCELENGKKNPSFEMLESLSIKTEVPMDEFSTKTMFGSGRLGKDAKL